MGYSRLAFVAICMGLVFVGCSKREATDTTAQNTVPVYNPPAPPLPPVDQYGPALPIGDASQNTTTATNTVPVTTNTQPDYSSYQTATSYTDPGSNSVMDWIPHKKKKHYDWLDTGFPGAANTMIDCRSQFNDLTVIGKFIATILKNRRFPLSDNLFSNYGQGFHNGSRGMHCMNKLGRIVEGLTSFEDNLRPGALNSWFSGLLQWTSKALPYQGFDQAFSYASYSFIEPTFSGYVPFSSLGGNLGWGYNPYAPGIGPF